MTSANAFRPTLRCVQCRLYTDNEANNTCLG